jgi:hypothetical protein
MQEGPGPDFTLTFRAAVTPYGTARPERVIEALVAVAGVKLQIEGIRRIEVHLS